jgi:O-antigen/teichoic acid export membrane protein
VSFIAEDPAPRPAPAKRPREGRILGLVYVAWAINLGGNQLFTLLLFFLLPAASVGLINWGTAAGSLVFYIIEAGVETALVIAAKRDAVSLKTMTLVVGAIRLLTAAIVFAAWLAGIALHLLHREEAVVLLLVGLGFVLRSFQTPFTASLQVRDRQDTAALVGVSQVVARFAALGIVIALGLLSVNWVLTASLTGDIVALVALGYAAAREGGNRTGDGLSVRALTRAIARAAPLITASQAVMQSQARIDWLLVVAFLSYTALANYSIANKAVELLVLAGSVFGRTALPWFVEGWGSRNISRPIRMLATATIVLSLGLALWGTAVLHLLFHAKYEGASPVIPLLAVLGPGLVLFQVVQFALLGRGRTLDTVIAGGAGVAAQVVTDLLLIPPLGIVGAAFGMWAFTFVGFPTMLWMALKRHVVPRRVVVELSAAALVLPVGLTIAMLLHR